MARKKPAPISLKKTRKTLSVPAEPVAPFNKDAPEHKPKRLKTIRNKRLESTIESVKELKAQVSELSGRSQEVVVKMPVRPRIERIAIEYDSLGHPKALVPAYGE